MNLIKLMIRSEFRLNYRRIILGLIFNIIGTALLYAAFIPCLGKILPRIDYLELDQFIFPAIIGLLNAMLALGLTSSSIQRHFKNTRGDYQRLAGTGITQIYSGFLVNYGLILLIHLVVSTLTLAAFAGYIPGFGTLLLFWAFVMLSLVFFIQIGILIGLDSDQRDHFYWIFLVILPVFLMSGMIVPSHFHDGITRFILSGLPSTALIEGGRDILMHQPFNILYVFYLLVLNVFVFIGVLYFFKGKMNR